MRGLAALAGGPFPFCRCDPSSGRLRRHLLPQGEKAEHFRLATEQFRRPRGAPENSMKTSPSCSRRVGRLSGSRSQEEPSMSAQRIILVSPLADGWAVLTAGLEPLVFRSGARAEAAAKRLAACL